MPIRGIPIEDILRKSEDPFEEPKVCVVRGVRSYEDEGSNWAADQVVKSIKRILPEAQIADVSIPSYRVLSGVSNDPDSSIFDPKDQFPIILDMIKQSDVLLFAATESCGFPDSNTVRLFQRLAEYIHDKKESGDKDPHFKNKIAGIVVHGKCGVYQAMSNMNAACNKMGITVVRRGLAGWNKKQGSMYKDNDFSISLNLMGESIAKILKCMV